MYSPLFLQTISFKNYTRVKLKYIDQNAPLEGILSQMHLEWGMDGHFVGKLDFFLSKPNRFEKFL